MKRPVSTARVALFTLTLAAAVALGGPAFARKGPGGPDGPRAELNLRMLERAADRLGLDEPTLDRIKERVYQAEKTGIDLKAKLELARLELRRTLDADTPAKDAVMKRIDEVGRLETDLRKHQIGLMLDVKAMLTPEQRRELEKMSRRGGRELREKRGKRERQMRRSRAGDRPAPPAPPPPPMD